MATFNFKFDSGILLWRDLLWSHQKLVVQRWVKSSLMFYLRSVLIVLVHAFPGKRWDDSNARICIKRKQQGHSDALGLL